MAISRTGRQDKTGKSGTNTDRRADSQETQDKRNHYQCENLKDKERRMANKKEEGIQVDTEDGGGQLRITCEVKEGLSERRSTLSEGWEKKIKNKKKGTLSIEQC